MDPTTPASASPTMDEADLRYVPIPSIGHELGIMFGFMVLMMLSAVIYWICWQAFQRKVDRIEDERRIKLSKTPLYSGRYDEKARGRSDLDNDTDLSSSGGNPRSPDSTELPIEAGRGEDLGTEVRRF